MGILNDFKRLFWAKKSVAKSTAHKVGKEAKELAEEGYEKVKDFSIKVADKAEDAFEDAKDYTSDLMDEVWKKKEESTGASTSAGSTTGTGTTESSSARTSGTEPKQKDSVVDKAVEMSDKAWEKAEDVGEKVRTKAEEMAAKAKEMAKKAGERVDEKIDDMLERANALDKKIEEEKDAIDKNRDGFADKPLNEKLREHDSLLKDKDDFWSKADQYGKGDYSMGKPVVVKPEKTEDETLDLKPIKGFKDNDGDGDSLIDDADVDGFGPEDRSEARRILYALDAILRLHFAQEEELLASIALDRPATS